ncbi:DUF6114 domain-containing protein [Couchioplanes caeruleus]|uniref:Uncharacterized protein n=2 Tax=Couchioplanes caeruleus TaxID=56438 RepID=A0A1K0GBQ5_9ACTN|nr:DUF6114 domain-containing protein [Couchioplanes caeruleus]OJF09598.1 hypothetical protein BG844_36765 [Couchioplanes caeruleus subsp. caeruleus]ROP27425.1 hypothetical protein EDD30_0094 [Couchioplanes caeruleus]
MATPRTTAGGGFRHWRRTRPFWGGLLFLLSGLELFLSANLTLGDLQVHFGPEGFLSYLLPLLLLLCGLLTWLTPGQRIFYGILGLLTAVYSLIGLNLGGFAVGMLIGILGGALVLAWTPQRPQPEIPIPADVDEAADPADPDGDAAQPRTAYDEPAPQDRGPDPDETAVLRPAGHNGQNGIVPGFQGGEARPDDDPGQQPRPFGGVHRKALAIGLVPLVVGAIVVTSGRTPARADEECPEGLPSRPAAAAKKEAARQSSASLSPSGSAAKAKTATTKTSAPQAARRGATPSSPSDSAPAKADDAEEGDGESGNIIVEGWNNLVDGVGDLLGLGDDDAADAAEATEEAGKAEEAGEPSTPPSAPPAPAPAPSAPGPAEPAEPTTPGKPAPDASDDPAPGTPTGSASASTPASAAPTPSLPDIPCLGPRVFKVAGPDDVPTVSLGGGILESKSLTMYNSTYDGVSDLPTAEGTIKALKFSMRKTVTKPFQLTVPEQSGASTVINSDELITEGNVRFYTPRFQGKLFGLIPVTFTPDKPPPLTLPILWFTDVKIQLAFVRCDTLTAEPLKLTEKS